MVRQLASLRHSISQTLPEAEGEDEEARATQERVKQALSDATPSSSSTDVLSLLRKVEVDASARKELGNFDEALSQADSDNQALPRIPGVTRMPSVTLIMRTKRSPAEKLPKVRTVE
jgi:hypothetical protein